MDIEMTKVMQLFSFKLFFLNPFYFHVLPFGQGHQPIIEWAKGLCKLCTQGKEADQHKAQKLFAWCFLF